LSKSSEAELAHTYGHLAASLGSRSRFLGVILAGHIGTWQPPFPVFFERLEVSFQTVSDETLHPGEAKCGLPRNSV